MKRVFFLIRSLERGGAERQLVELVGGLSQDGFYVTVCTFYDGGALRGELERMPGVNLVSLGKRGRWDVARFLWRLQRSVRVSKPDIIHGYMAPANELAVLMARMSGAKAVCGLRSSNMDLTRYDQFVRFAFRLGASVSHFADAIIVNSEAGRDYHAAAGYRSDRMVVIHNGIDCEAFQLNLAARHRIRSRWGVDPQHRVVGLVARQDPKKDHANFVRAAALVATQFPNARFVCVGEQRQSVSRRLRALERQIGLSDRIIWTGATDDACSIYSALDVVALSSSFGEGFPNVVGEAMAVGRPCVVTRVGDAATVVGETGEVVPPRDSAALADGINALLRLNDDELAVRGRAARERIVSTFSRRRLIDSTEATLAALVSRNQDAKP